ncbi:hypothetical protein IJS77_00150, partial [bacterium]|nr:hypothetical protein [bacterium]
LSNNSLKPLLLRNANNKKEEYVHWEKNAELASYLGDTNLYVISLKQQLKIADEVPDAMNAQKRISAFEKLGKILYKISPKETMNYLSAAIAYYKEETNYNPVKIIELSAFLAQACSQSEDYFGVIETCDVALAALPAGQYEVEKALITSKKLHALLYLGNFEEIVNISKTELLEVMETALAKSNISDVVSDENIFDAWFDTCLNLATAYAMKGDIKAFDTLTNLDNALIANKIEDIDCMRKVLITKALSHTMKGEVKTSSDILLKIKSKYLTDDISEEFILKWNLVNIINKIISADYQNIAEEMFQVTTFADNINNNFAKNLIKLLLGFVFQFKSKNTKKALEIYNEEIVYFSKEKIATGALLCWLLISNISVISRGVDFSLDIALKALDVAKGPKVGNYIFIIALKRQIAEIYMQKRDYEAVKMYLEKALALAVQNDLKFMQMLILDSFSKYYEELISLYKDEETQYAQKTIDTYKAAINISKTLMLGEYEADLVKDYTAFKVSCQLKNIPFTDPS